MSKPYDINQLIKKVESETIDGNNDLGDIMQDKAVL